MTGGDPYYATLFVPLLTYEEAFDRFRFGPGSALMLLVFLASAAAHRGHLSRSSDGAGTRA